MHHTGYAIVAIEDVGWTDDGSGGRRAALTDRLGCSDTHVDAYRTRSDASVPPPAERERLCVPVHGSGTLTAGGEPDEDEARRLDQSSVALVPAGTHAALGGEATWLVVSAPADPPSGGAPVVVDLAHPDFSVPTTSDVPTARLTGRLGCLGMKVNVRRLGPDDVVPYHTEGSQEELFAPLDGDGVVRVDGGTFAVPRGSVARVAPELPRSAVNPGTEDVHWLMVGAPTTGAPEEWDPGAEIHEWPGPD